MRRFWSEMRADAFSAADDSWIAVLPLAAIEQHGPHLPTGTDAYIGQALTEASAEALPADVPAFFLPQQAVGKSDEHISFPGTVTLDWDTAIRSWFEIGESVARARVRRLLLITSHGGNSAAMEIVAGELRRRCGMLVAKTSWEKLGAWQHDEPRIDIHGGAYETSLMLAIRPDLVDLDAAQGFGSAQSAMKRDNAVLGYHSSKATLGWQAQDLAKAGVTGDPGKADSEQGRREVAAIVRSFAALIDEIGRAPLPADRSIA